jgi:hypothetical protein
MSTPRQAVFYPYGPVDARHGYGCTSHTEAPRCYPSCMLSVPPLPSRPSLCTDPYTTTTLQKQRPKFWTSVSLLQGKRARRETNPQTAWLPQLHTIISGQIRYHFFSQTIIRSRVSISMGHCHFLVVALVTLQSPFRASLAHIVWPNVEIGRVQPLQSWAAKSSSSQSDS